MMATQVRILTLILIVSVAVSSCASPSPQAAAESTPGVEALKVCSIQPMTGPFAYYGQLMGGGLLYGVTEINESGELPFPMEVVIIDHKSGDPTAGMAGVRKCLDIDNVSFIVATWGNIVPIAQAAGAEAGVPTFNGGAAAPELTGLPYMHNDILMVDQMIFPMLDIMRERYDFKRPAIIHWNESEGFGARDASAWWAEQNGMTVVAIEGHEPGKTDYRAELTRIKAANPDALFLWSQGTDTGYVAKQAREIGLDVPIATFQEINPEAMEVAGPEVFEGALLASEYLNPESDRPEVQGFVEGFTTWAGFPPEHLVANYYDIANIIRDAAKHVVEQGGDPFDGEQLEKAIQEIRLFTTVYGDGRLEILPNGCTLKQVAVFEVHDGEFELLGEYPAPDCQKYEEATAP